MFSYQQSWEEFSRLISMALQMRRLFKLKVVLSKTKSKIWPIGRSLLVKICEWDGRDPPKQVQLL